MAVIAATSASAEAPKRIASVNLCADQLLIALAKPERIAALGPFARDSTMSYFHREAERHPSLSGRSEELIRLSVDALLVGPYDNKAMLATLRKHGAPQIVVERWTSLADTRAGVVEFAERIGEGAAGLKLVEEIDVAVDDLRKVALHLPRRRTFLILHRRGYVGEGGVVSELLETGGLVDVAKGAPPRFLDVESILAARPDVLVVERSAVSAQDRGLELLGHPALRRLYPPARRLTAPDRLTMCAGPATPALARHFREQIEALSPGL